MWGKVLSMSTLPQDHLKVFKSITKYSYVNRNELIKTFPEIYSKSKKGTYIPRICEPLDFRLKVRKGNLILKNKFHVDVKDSTRYKSKCGIPQGTPISACLSNIYMLDFDKIINEKISEVGGMYRRYSDDIIIVIEPKYRGLINDLIQKELINSHLTLNCSKTEVVEFSVDLDGSLQGYDLNGNKTKLQYLGFEFSGKEIYIRSSSMSRYHSRLSSKIRESLKAAYGKRSKGNHVFKKKLYNRYTIKGKRNFITYAHKAAKEMKSDTIRKQYKNNFLKVTKKFEEKKLKYEEDKKPNRILK